MLYILIACLFFTCSIQAMEGIEKHLLRNAFEDIRRADKEEKKEEVTHIFQQSPSAIIKYLICHMRQWDLAYRVVRANQEVSYQLTIEDLHRGGYKYLDESPQFASRLLTYVNPKYLSEWLLDLDLSNNNLYEQPVLTKLVSLQKLNLSRNPAIKKFSSSDCPLTLQSLDISGLSLKDLHIIDLCNLKVLTAKDLQYLKHIFIRFTKLTDITITPEDIPLEELDLYGNAQLTSVSLTTFPHLTHVNLAQTALAWSFIIKCYSNIAYNNVKAY